MQTQVRVRPGDFILIAGLISEQENYSGSGPGINEPLFNTSKTTTTDTSELVVMLRPRVVVYVPPEENKNVVLAKANPVQAVSKQISNRSFLGSLSLDSLNPSLGNGGF